MKPSYILDRVKLKRSISLWRNLSLLLLFLLACVFYVNNEPSEQAGGLFTLGPTKSYVARISIDGIILQDYERQKGIDSLAKDKRAKAIIVHINSPGGSLAGSESLYRHLKALAKTKPLVVVMGEAAASGGYLASLSGERIFANPGTITGSIGVIMQSAEFTELADSLGIKFNVFKSSELKAAPNPMEKLTPKVEKAINQSIQDSHKFFLNLVKEARKIDGEQLADVGDGRVFTGLQALKVGLIDEIGDENEALRWLKDNDKIPSSLEIVEVDLYSQSSKVRRFIQNNLNPIGLLQKSNLSANKLFAF